MSTTIWTKETLLDLSVNIIPLFIIAFFFIGYIVFNPFEGPALGRYIQFAIMLIIGIALAVLTHQAALRIEVDE